MRLSSLAMFLAATVSMTEACLVTDLIYDSYRARLWGSVTDNGEMVCSIALTGAFRTAPKNAFEKAMHEEGLGCVEMDCIDDRKVAVCRYGDFWNLLWRVDSWTEIGPGREAEQVGEVKEVGLDDLAGMRMEVKDYVGGNFVLLDSVTEEGQGLRITGKIWDCPA